MAGENTLPPEDAANAAAPESLNLDTLAPSDQHATLGDPHRTLLDQAPSEPTFPDVELPALHPRAHDGYDDGVHDLIPGPELGRGAMGIVHSAVQRSLDREVAVKTIRPDRLGRDQRALVAEARVLGQLAHPNIPPIHALYYGTDGPVLVMKHVEGVTWKALLHDDNHPAWANTPWADESPLHRHLQILLIVCDPIRFAHTRNIVHRDIKPDNVMIGAFGEVYVLDWGVATRLTSLPCQTGSVVGTPAYLSPEMACGRVGKRSDIFLLGAVLHRILVGSTRHSGSSVPEVLHNAKLCAPYTYPAHLPADLTQLAAAACSREPRDRPATVEIFQAALRAHLRHGAARALADVAEARLAAAERLFEAGREPGTASSLLTEARFASLEALRQWPDHPTARLTLIHVFHQGIELALKRGDVDGAEAWLSDAAEAGQDVKERLHALRTRNANLKQLQNTMAGLDPSVDRIPRTVFIAGCGGVMLLVAWIVSRGGNTYALALWTSGNIAVGTMVALGLARKRLLATVFNRQITMMVLLSSILIFVNRYLSSVRGVSLNEALTQDLLLITAMTGIGSLAVGTWMMGLCALYALAAVLATIQPSWTPTLLPLASAISVVFVGLRWMYVHREQVSS